MIKRVFIIAIAAIVSAIAPAQDALVKTTMITIYKDFQPARITLTNGKVVAEKQANIFIKNGALLYKHGVTTMQANMKQIKDVDFADRSYVRIDSLLAYVVDTVKQNKLLCATLLDMDAYRSQMINDRQITDLNIGDNVGVTTIEGMASDEDNQFPLVNHFYYEINGKIVSAHERDIRAIMPKDKRRAYKTIIQSPNFGWSNANSLLKILELL